MQTHSTKQLKQKNVNMTEEG